MKWKFPRFRMLLCGILVMLPSYKTTAAPGYLKVVAKTGLEFGATFGNDWYHEYYNWFFVAATADVHAGSGIFLTGGVNYIPTGLAWNNSGTILEIGTDLAFSVSRDRSTYYCLSGRIRRSAVSFNVIFLGDFYGDYTLNDDVWHKGRVNDTQVMFGIAMRDFIGNDPDFMMRPYLLFVYNIQDIEDTQRLRTGTNPDVYDPATFYTQKDNGLGFTIGLEARLSFVYFDLSLGGYHGMFMSTLATGFFF